MATTQLHPGAIVGRAYGSFAGKTQVSVTHPLRPVIVYDFRHTTITYDPTRDTITYDPTRPTITYEG